MPVFCLNMLMTRLIKNSVFVSRQSERLQSLGGVGCLPVIECRLSTALSERDASPSVSTRAAVYISHWVLSKEYYWFTLHDRLILVTLIQP